MIYAKSEPKETLREHTDALIEECKILRHSYGEKIESLIEIDIDKFWHILDIIIEFHDLGKIFTPFQNVIREKIGENRLETTFENDVYHNYISPVFLKYKDLGIDKDLKDIVVQSIGYHHERGVMIDKEFKEKIQDILDRDISNNIHEIEKEFIKYPIKTDGLQNGYLGRMERRIKPTDKRYNLYVLLKGLTHRLDHSASAHEIIELNSEENVGEYTEDFITKNYGELREVQKFAKQNRDKNVVLIASTGMGKTETALLWIDNDKAFFTLPLRVSINALFDRVSKEDIKYDYAGLLHSSSLDYMEENKYEDYEERVNQSKLMSKKLTFSTIDQIFKFPFMYRGYEKEYATLAYSKVIIDEIQAYSPEISAVLIKGIEMIHKIGGRFMIMTATMPTIYIDELKNRGVVDDDFVTATYNTDVIRHNMKLKDESLYDNLEQIVKEGSNKKVLVIVNTVKRAIDIYEEIKNLNSNTCLNINLLHSMYIKEHRSKLESSIKEFARGSENGIWITTQLVEASLDVDFDILHTEESTLDSLFQRFGRCNRKGKKSIDSSNIFIYTQDATGIGTIYDEELVDKGIDLLRNAIETQGKDNCFKISENIKVELVEKLYSKENLRGTEFYKKFIKALEVLDSISPYELSKNEAQSILRNIETDTVIPRSIFDSIRDTLIEQYKQVNEKLIDMYKEKEKDKDVIKGLKRERNSLRLELFKKTVNIPTYKTRKGGITSIEIKGLEDLKIIEYQYDINEINGKIFGKGVLIGEDLNNIL